MHACVHACVCVYVCIHNVFYYQIVKSVVIVFLC